MSSKKKDSQIIGLKFKVTSNTLRRLLSLKYLAHFCIIINNLLIFLK